MILASRRVVCEDGVRPASIHVDSGRIARIDSAAADVDFGDLVISPGLVDTHVHVNEPGRTGWEGFDTATRAAAAGGVTTIVDMPLNCIPATTTPAALEAKRAAARGQCHVDVGFWGGVVPGNAGELDALVDAGVRGFKCFLAPSGVGEFPMVAERDLRDAMPTLARRDVALLVHAEDPAHLTQPADETYAAYLASRPPEAERAAIDMMASLAREYGARIHIVHVASAEAVDAVRRAKAGGVRITAETCPHYLTFADDEISDAATEFKCAPPIRDARHRHALWQALADGVLDLIATDHSPAPPSMKTGGVFTAAWGGIASLEISLAAMFTEGTGRFPAGDPPPERLALLSLAPAMSRLLSAAPAALARLDTRKGRIARGFDADLVVWNPDATWIVDPPRLQQRHKLTPYAGRSLRGTVHATYVRGACVWRDGSLVGAAHGRFL